MLRILSHIKKLKQWKCEKQRIQNGKKGAGSRKEKQDVQTYTVVEQRQHKENWYTWMI